MSINKEVKTKFVEAVIDPTALNVYHLSGLTHPIGHAYELQNNGSMYLWDEDFPTFTVLPLLPLIVRGYDNGQRIGNEITVLEISVKVLQTVVADLDGKNDKLLQISMVNCKHHQGKLYVPLLDIYDVPDQIAGDMTATIPKKLNSDSYDIIHCGRIVKGPSNNGSAYLYQFRYTMNKKVKFKNNCVGTMQDILENNIVLLFATSAAQEGVDCDALSISACIRYQDV